LKRKKSQDKFLVTKFEFGGTFKLSGVGEFRGPEVEVTPNLGVLLNELGESLLLACIHNSTTSLNLIWWELVVTKNSFKKLPSN
jgi:hypothetical protein